VVFQLAEAPREGDVFGAGDVLVTEEQDFVLEQQLVQLSYEILVA
jgi:hypothetical protein